MTEREVVVLPTPDAVVSEVATRLLKTVSDVLAIQDRFELVLTGGTVGIAVLKMACSLEDAKTIAWERVRFWFGDERFVEKNSQDRNDVQASGFFETLGIEESKIMRFPTTDSGYSLDEAAAKFAKTIENAFTGKPRFDLALNGMGPDGHVASLFPGQVDPDATSLVIPVPDSPKPPSRRLSLSLQLLNSAERIWIFATGVEKAEAVAGLLNKDKIQKTPATGLAGSHETVLFADEAAFSQSD